MHAFSWLDGAHPCPSAFLSPAGPSGTPPQQAPIFGNFFQRITEAVGATRELIYDAELRKWVSACTRRRPCSLALHSLVMPPASDSSAQTLRLGVRLTARVRTLPCRKAVPFVLHEGGKALHEIQRGKLSILAASSSHAGPFD